MPPIAPPTLTAVFHGYSKKFFEYISILYFKYSVDLVHAVSPILSGGYADMAIALRPDGRFSFAASHIMPLPTAKATSLLFFMVKCQVRFPLAIGRMEG